MFLFEVGRRRILHVGDFRWNKEVMLTQAPLRPFARGEVVLDELFLDTTYCDPMYAFPSQSRIIEETVNVAVKEVAFMKKTKRSFLLLFGAYTIGKERVYMAVAECLGVKVYVEPRRFRTLSALEWPQEQLSLFTTRPEDTFLWVVPSKWNECGM